MKYRIVRTDLADSQIRSIILYIAEKFGNTVAVQKLDALEKKILTLGDNPSIGTEPVIKCIDFLKNFNFL